MSEPRSPKQIRTKFLKIRNRRAIFQEMILELDAELRKLRQGCSHPTAMVDDDSRIYCQDCGFCGAYRPENEQSEP